MMSKIYFIYTFKYINIYNLYHCRYSFQFKCEIHLQVNRCFT